MRRLSVLVVGVLGALAAGCGDEVELRIDVRTDLVPGIEFSAVRTELLRGDGRTTLRTRTESAFRSHDFVAGRRVAELGGLEPGAYVVRAALLDAAGAALAARVVRLEIESDFLAVIVITRDCVALPCPGPGDPPGLTSCNGGRCEDPACFEHPSECAAPECSADGDCPVAADCADVRCLDGACFYASRPEACAELEWCDVERGCTPLAGPRDAGPAIDAGPAVDAGRLDGGPLDAGSRVDACVTGCGPPVCVDGVEPACGHGDRAERWTGSTCCVAGPVECVDGVAAACTGAGEHWTGRICCVDGPATCGSGVAAACSGGPEHWTGSLCCVQGAICADGVAMACDDAGEHWTGTTCCVVGARTCVAGSPGACDGAGEHWTGSQCCVE